MTSPDPLLAEALEAWDEAGLRREITMIDGVDFCTNDYLGLARDSELTRAVRNAVRDWGAGSRAARLLGGQLPIHESLEREAAAWLGTESALLFPSGYQANVGLMTTAASAEDVILSDAHNHASLIDGMRLSAAAVRTFTHNRPAALDQQLADCGSYRARWIVIESVYSMDGSHAPLAAYVEIAKAHDAWLIVDEAHAVGLYGPKGQGRAAGLTAEDRVAARVVTGGKALGASGALVAGSKALIDLLINRARAFVFTTAPPPATVAALRTAIVLVAGAAERRAQAHTNASRLRTRLAGHGLEPTEGSPIVFLPLGQPDTAVAAAAAIQDAGFHVRAVRPPTVPVGSSGLRVVCHADHDVDTIDKLAAKIAEVVPAGPLKAPDTHAPKTPWIVVGTDTDVGKTVASAVILRALKQAGARARYWKVLQTGRVSDTEAVIALAELAPHEHLAPIVELPLPASVDQAALDASTTVDATSLVMRLRDELAREPDVQFVLETAGGLLVPLNDHEDQADLVRRLGGDIVLVARSGLGTLNHTRLTVEALRRRGLPLRALLLVGPPHAANLKTLSTWLPGVPIFELPPLDPLTTQAIDAWVAANDLISAMDRSPTP